MNDLRRKHRNLSCPTKIKSKKFCRKVPQKMVPVQTLNFDNRTKANTKPYNSHVRDKKGTIQKRRTNPEWFSCDAKKGKKVISHLSEKGECYNKTANRILETNDNITIATKVTNCLPDNANRLNISGFKYDDKMNILIIQEDSDDHFCPDKGIDSENTTLEEKVSDSENSILEDKVKDSQNFHNLLLNYTQHSCMKNCADNTEQEVFEQILEGMKDVVGKNEVENKGKECKAEETEGNGKELLELLLFERKLSVRTDILVYMEQGSVHHPPTIHHPPAIEDIPWKWLNEEKWRLHTYSRYPHSANKSAILLAAAGFAFYSSGKSNDDRVICFFCCATKQDWQSSDIITVVHKDLSPNCSMVTGIGCNNVPMKAPGDGLSLFIQLNYGEIGPTEVQQHKTGQGIDREGIESDSPHVHRQSFNQSTQNLPVLTTANSGHSASAHAAKPIQMANQTVMSTGNFTSSHTGQSATIPARPTETGTQGSDNNSFSSTRSAMANSRTAIQTPAQNTQQLSEQTTTSSTPTILSPVRSVDSSSQNNLSTATVSTATTSSSSTTSSTVNQSTNPPQDQGNSSHSAPGETQSSSRPAGRSPTYLELGIITERPKRFEYAVRAKRYDSFEPWPRDHHLKKEDLADAGFYYAGYGDCARCFYCGGGLRNWEDNDNVWVEHARWFPKCAFIRQTMGQQFVDAVQDLNRDHDQITFEMVTQKMGGSASSFQLDTKNMPLKRDPAVITIRDMGYKENDVFEAANFVKESYGTLSADKLFEKLERDGKPRDKTATSADSKSIRSTAGMSKDEIVMNQLKEQNSQLRQQTICKICMDKEVGVVFLPCGHLVSCTDCAVALKDCPVCRNNVRGIVRAFMA